jgi:tetratricopeptide (TPR) repeat protein
VVDQHLGTTNDAEWYRNTFADCIKSIGCTLLVLQPFNAPLPLTRAWCVWEFLCTISAGGVQLEVVLAPKQQLLLEQALHISFDVVFDALSNINTRIADTNDPSDRAIHDAVRESPGGYPGVNARIKRCLIAWLASVLAKIHRERCETFGDCHADTLSAGRDLAFVMQRQGLQEEAERLFCDTLQQRRETLGDNHPDTLTSLHDLACMLTAQRKLDEAEPLLRDALRGRREMLGDRHPDTLTSQHSLAGLCRAQGQLAAAEALHLEVLRWREETLGESHPDTLTSLRDLAWCRHAQDGRAAEAVSLARRAAAGFTAVLGQDHEHTHDALHALAAALQAADQNAEAAAIRATVSGLSPSELQFTMR